MAVKIHNLCGDYSNERNIAAAKTVKKDVDNPVTAAVQPGGGDEREAEQDDTSVAAEGLVEEGVSEGAEKAAEEASEETGKKMSKKKKR